MSRRFHAEPNACPACGPGLSLLDGFGALVEAPDPLAEAVRRLRSGAILAVKGLGGFHLVCNARDATAVDRMRRLKQRDGKPFAVMSPDVDAIRAFACVAMDEADLLATPARPIVLLRKADLFDLAEGIAPNNAFIGAMLPYAPLHHRILSDGAFTALVMTSANPHDEPIASGNDEAVRRLSGIADGFLVHDRDIVTRCDDSVAAVLAGRTRMIRRSRGYVPLPISMPVDGPPILAVGADLKNAFCVTRGGLAFMGPHVGDLANAATAVWFEEAAMHLCGLLNVRPAAVAHDMHPDYMSTRLATLLRDLLCPDAPLVPVHHHHAHVLSCLAEHRRTGPVIGLALDGTGYGTDGTIWGGEILMVDGANFGRHATLRPLPLPGGDMATLEPWRLAVSILHQADADNLVAAFSPRWPVDSPRIDAVLGLCRNGRDLPRSSGLGRLFDAVSALCGLCPLASFDGQAAMAVEHAAIEVPGQPDPYPWEVDRAPTGLSILDPRPMVLALAADLLTGTPPSVVCARFQATVVCAYASMAIDVAVATGLSTIALSGGAFQNRHLLAGISRRLLAAGLDVLSQSLVPANDGGIALGQAVAALCRQ
jgi:hydrogenase maturation protein HypF